VFTDFYSGFLAIPINYFVVFVFASRNTGLPENALAIYVVINLG